MGIRLASPEEFGQVTAFYRDICQRTPDMGVYGHWIYGKHPTDAMLLDYLRQGCLFLWEEEGTPAAAMALTPYQTDFYHGIPWARPLEDDEVAVVHVFCVSPDFRGKGMGRKMMAEAIRLSREAGKKALRLDALDGNLPAHRVYRDAGLLPMGTRPEYYPNTGHADFIYYELLLEV